MNLILRNIRQLLTVASEGYPYKTAEAMGDLKILTDAAIRIENGILTWIGADADFPREETESFETFDASEYIALPGFVDVLTFPFFPNSKELRSLRFPTDTHLEAATVSVTLSAFSETLTNATKPDIKKTARTAFDTMLRHGTTTLEAVVGGTGSEKTEQLLFQCARELVNEHLLDIQIAYHVTNIHANAEILSWLTKRFLPHIQERHYATDLLIEIGNISEENLQTLFSSVTELPFQSVILTDFLHRKNTVWVDTKKETLRCLLAAPPSADDILLLAQRKTIPFVLPPFAVLAQKSGFSLRPLLQAGVPLALGTGFHPAFVHSPSMQQALVLACTHFGLTPEEALTAATLNAAAALGRSDTIGSIEPGKQADIILAKAEDYRDLFYISGVNHIAKIIKNGVLLDF